MVFAVAIGTKDDAGSLKVFDDPGQAPATGRVHLRWVALFGRGIYVVELQAGCMFFTTVHTGQSLFIVLHAVAQHPATLPDALDVLLPVLLVPAPMALPNLLRVFIRHKKVGEFQTRPL